MRPDVGTGDLALLVAQLLRPVPGLPTELTQRSVERSLDLVLNRLRVRDDNQQPLHQAIASADLDPGGERGDDRT